MDLDVKKKRRRSLRISQDLVSINQNSFTSVRLLKANLKYKISLFRALSGL